MFWICIIFFNPIIALIMKIKNIEDFATSALWCVSLHITNQMEPTNKPYGWLQPTLLGIGYSFVVQTMIEYLGLIGKMDRSVFGLSEIYRNMINRENNIHLVFLWIQAKKKEKRREEKNHLPLQIFTELAL